MSLGGRVVRPPIFAMSVREGRGNGFTFFMKRGTITIEEL